MMPHICKTDDVYARKVVEMAAICTCSQGQSCEGEVILAENTKLGARFAGWQACSMADGGTAGMDRQGGQGWRLRGEV